MAPSTASIALTTATSEPLPVESDQRLIKAAQSGSKAAAEKLARRHWDDAYKAALLITGSREDAEDVAQESLVAAVQGIGRFRRGRPFEPWLHRIVTNRAIDIARIASRRRDLHEVLATTTVVTLEQGDAGDERLIAAITALSLDQRVVVVMRHALGYETSEIARNSGDTARNHRVAAAPRPGSAQSRARRQR